MAILDGLKHGYPTYFTYQPSQGLNPQLLAYAMRGRSSYPSQRTSTSSQSTKKKYEDVDGPRGQLEDYGVMEDAMNRRESSLRQGYANWLMQNDFDMQSTEGQNAYNEFVQGMTALQTAKSKQSRNRSYMSQAIGTYSDVDQALVDKELTGHAFVGTLSPGFMRKYGVGPTGRATGSQSTVVAYGYKDGKKVPINAFYLGDDGEVYVNKNVKGFFSMQDMMNFQRENMGFDEEGLAQQPFVPSMYDPGKLQETLDGLVKQAGGSISEFAMAAKFDPNTGRYVGSSGEETDYIMEAGNNFGQLKAFLNNAFTNVSDQNLLNEAQSNWANDIMSGRVVYVPNAEGTKLIGKRAENVSMDDYITAKAAGLVDMNKRSTVSVKGRPGADSENNENFSYNYNDIIGNPAILQENGVQSQKSFFLTGGQTPPDQFTEEAGKKYNVWTVPMSSKSVKDRNQTLIGTVNPTGSTFDVRDSFEFSRGMITEDGTLFFPGDAKNPVYYKRHTGKALWMPRYSDDPNSGGLEFGYSLTPTVGHDGKPGVAYSLAEEVEIYIKGSDLLDDLHLKSVDEDAIEAAKKADLRAQQAGRELPQSVTIAVNRLKQARRSKARYDESTSVVTRGGSSSYRLRKPEDGEKDLSASYDKAIENAEWALRNVLRGEKINDFNWETMTAPLTAEEMEEQTEQIMTTEIHKRSLGRFGQLREYNLKDGEFTATGAEGTQDRPKKIHKDKYYAISMKFYPSVTQNLSVGESKSNRAKFYNNAFQNAGAGHVPNDEALSESHSALRNEIATVNQ